MIIKSNLIDIVRKQIYAAELIIEDNKIVSVTKISETLNTYILPRTKLLS